MTKRTRQELFDYLRKTFGLKNLDKVDMQEIENIVAEDYKKLLRSYKKMFIKTVKDENRTSKAKE